MATVSDMSRRSAVIAALFAGIVVLAAVSPVRAHEAPAFVTPQPAAAPEAPPPLPATSSLPAAGADAPGAEWLLLLAAVAALSSLSRRPRAAAVALALLLGIFAFERGEHSVHHLGQ